jgi:hypothetical protein
MAEMQLPLTVEYVSTRESQMSLWRLVGRDVHAELRDYDRGTAIMFGFLSVSGLYASFMGGHWVTFLVIAAGSMAIGQKLWKEHRSALQRVENALELGVGKCIKLEIGETGFTEHDRGVESFCPWKTIKNYCVFEEVLFVELANEQWAIVPGATLKPANVTLAQIEEILAGHGLGRRE